MSISAPLAVTMMIGTWLRLRSWRHTSMPRDLGQHHVEQHEVGVARRRTGRAPRRRRGRPATRKPSRRRPDRQRVDEATPRPRRSARWSARSCSPCLRACRGGSDRRRAGPAGTRSVNVEPSPSVRRDRDRRRRGWWRRGARWPARGRCRRSRGCGPGRPGRSARRCGRGRGPGCRCRGRRTDELDPAAVGRGPRPRPRRPASEYFTRVLEQVGRAPRRSWRRSPTTLQPARRLVDGDRDAARCSASGADALDGLGDDGGRRRPPRVSGWLAELDAGQLSRSSMMRADAVGLGDHLVGQPARRPPGRPRRPASRPAARARRPASSARG